MKHVDPPAEPEPEKSENEKPLPFDISGVGPATEKNPLEAKTLSGDIRDMILTHIRSMTVPWAMLNEKEQSDKIYAATQAGQDLVRQCLHVIAANKLPALHVSVGAYKVDKHLEVKLAVSPSVANITALAQHANITALAQHGNGAALAQHGNGAALLILAEPQDYYGERAPAKAKKDQPKLPLGGKDDDD